MLPASVEAHISRFQRMCSSSKGSSDMIERMMEESLRPRAATEGARGHARSLVDDTLEPAVNLLRPSLAKQAISHVAFAMKGTIPAGDGWEKVRHERKLTRFSFTLIVVQVDADGGNTQMEFKLLSGDKARPAHWFIKRDTNSPPLTSMMVVQVNESPNDNFFPGMEVEKSQGPQWHSIYTTDRI